MILIPWPPVGVGMVGDHLQALKIRVEGVRRVLRDGPHHALLELHPFFRHAHAAARHHQAAAHGGVAVPRLLDVRWEVQQVQAGVRDLRGCHEERILSQKASKRPFAPRVPRRAAAVDVSQAALQFHGPTARAQGSEGLGADGH